MKKYLIPIIISIAVAGVITLILYSSVQKADEDELPMGMYGGISESIVAYVSQSTGTAVYDGAAYLDRIIVGKDVTNQLISIVDTDTSTSLPMVLFQLEGSTLQGVYEIGARLHTGIWYTASNNDNVSIIYIPM